MADCRNTMYERLTKRVKPDCLKPIPELYKEYAVTIKNEIVAFEGCFDNKDIYEDYRMALDRLCDLEDKIEQGEIVELPCSVGQRIYRIMPKHDTLGYRTGEYKVADIWQVTEIVVYEEETVFVDDSGNEFMADDIGKTVFLTRAEAEKALERSENGK